MPVDQRLLDMLLRWEEGRAQGQPVTPEELCKDSPELLEPFRQRLADLQQADGLLETKDEQVPTSTVDPERPGPASNRAVPPDTQVLPGYELLGELGRGGMGVVYKARHLQLNRPVALKMVLEGSFASTEQRLRFLIEAEMAARVKHPNIAQVYDIGTHENRPYYALEFVSGGSLHQRLRRQRPTPREAAELVETLARAVQAAHAQGIIHRDLKPANILLEPDGTPKITDFGLAKDVGEWKRESVGAPADDAPTAARPQGLTRTGAIVGTPGYMAPEQAQGKSYKAGPSADIYALGAILYEALTARPPFTGSNPMEVVMKVLHEEPTPPRQLAPGVPRDLEVICLKCLQKEPAQRYPSAAELADDLRRFAEDRPIVARPAGRVERAWRWCRRNRAVAVLTGAVVTTLVAVSIVSVLFAFHSEQARQDIANEQAETSKALFAETQAREGERQARDRALGSLRDLTDDIVETQMARATHLTEENKEFLRKIIKHYEAFAALTADDAESRAIRAEGYGSVGLMRHRLGELKEAEAAYAEALALRKQLAADFPARFRADLAKSLGNLGLLLSETGRLKEAETAYAEALALRKQLAADFPTRSEFRRDLAGSHHNLGNLFAGTGRLTKAEAALADALAIQKRLAADFPSRPEFRHDLAKGHINLGGLLFRIGRLKETEAAFAEALAMQEQLAADFPNRPEFRQELATIHNNLGYIFRVTGQAKKAETALGAALGLQKKLAADFPTRPELRHELARTFNGLGVLFWGVNRHKDAESAYGDALAIQRQLALDFPTRPEFRRELSASHNNLGLVFRDMGRLNDAQPSLADGLAIRRQLAAEFPARPELRQELAASLNNLGLVLHDMSRLKDAEDAHSEALVIRKQLAADFPNQPDARNDVAGTLVDLASLSTQRRSFRTAREYLQEAQTHLDAAVKANSRNPRYRQRYSERLVALTGANAGLLDQSGALQAAEGIRDLGWNPPGDAYDAACALATCIPIVEKHEQLEAAKREASVRFYGDHAMAMLRDAVAKGFKDAARIKKDKDLDALHQREDFKTLLGQLEGKAADVTLAVIEFYDAWGKPAEAEKWFAKLPAEQKVRAGLQRHYAWPLLWGWPRF